MTAAIEPDERSPARAPVTYFESALTQEESEQGKVIGICLAEIERCRPYFIGMLGERYGWTPGKTDYPDELFEKEQLGWIRDHQGNASVTELEILHGVLNDKKMAGRAFFYFRDPAWSRAQSEPGFICDTPEEEAKLAALKARIRASGFPVAEDLPDPKAIADQIEADLWALIEEQYPELDQPDALEKEARKHASYRQSRLGVYLGQEYVDQLEALVHGGEQKILITGESGSGKSALIANWMHRHEREHPGDVVYAHHLGCSNDANAIRPLLCRMLDTASKLLEEADLITEPIKVPQDWWELTSKLAETLQDLGRWCKATGHRWIWVLDGLDRLAEEDQQALPWLPLLNPEGVSVVISALDCPARAILLERQFQLLEIGPLKRNEQEQLIETYLERYTKKLDADRVEQILACELAKSPLFLRVLLEELRQCGRFETLQDQIADYIRPDANGSLNVADLFKRVLERLERDCGVEMVHKALTALWASRAGLSETELLTITDLSPLDWVPIDLALEKAFGRNSNRLNIDHDYLRIAIRDRYLPTEKQQRLAHGILADWYSAQAEWDERKAEELPWQLQEGGRTNELRELLLNVKDLYELSEKRNNRELINYWLVSKGESKHELDELIAEAVEEQINNHKDKPEELMCFVEGIDGLLHQAGLYRNLLLRLRHLALELQENRASPREELILTCKSDLAYAYMEIGDYETALELNKQCLASRERLLGREHVDTLNSINNLGTLYFRKGDYESAEHVQKRCADACEKLLGSEHPKSLTSLNNLGCIYESKGDYEQAEALFKCCLQARERMLGADHPDTLSTFNNLGNLYSCMGNYEQAEELYKRSLEARERLLGSEHPDTLTIVANLALLYADKGNYEQAEVLLTRSLWTEERLRGPEHPETLTSVGNLASLFQDKGDYEQAEALYTRCLKTTERIFGPEHPSTNGYAYNLADVLSKQKRHAKAIPLRRRLMAWYRKQSADTDAGTLSSINALAIDLREAGELEEAEKLFRELVRSQMNVLKPEDFDIGRALGGLSMTLELADKPEEALHFRQVSLKHRLKHRGPDDYWTNRERLKTAELLHKVRGSRESLQLLDDLVASMSALAELDDADQQLIDKAVGLISEIRGAGD